MVNLRVVKEIEHKLKTRFVGRKILFYPQLPSTMETAREMAKRGGEEGTVIVAGNQTAGRGRRGRKWISPEGNLYFTLILRPQLVQLPQLVMLASVSVVRAIQEVSGLEADIKWPNDVLISGKKVCGILIENEVIGNAVRFSLIGMGLNVNFNSALFPEVAHSAGSLSQEEGVNVSCSEIMVALFTELEKLYLEMQEGVSPYEEWRKLMKMENKFIQVKDGEQIREGKVVEVMPDGALILLCADGSSTKIIAGDVFLQRTKQQLSSKG